MSSRLSPVELRHLLHQTPELAFSEAQTQRILIEAVESLGLRASTIAKTGLLVYLESEPELPTVLYRADMDALPIREETGWTYSSKNSNMHACGHDVHMAVAYGVLLRIVEDKLPGNYLFVFQPAEETIGGAKYVLEEMRERYKVKFATALHVTDEYKLGEFATTRGTLFACAMEVDAVFTGRSVHIAQKFRGVDALEKAVRFLHRFYSEPLDCDDVGRRVLVGFGKMRAGNVRNQLSDEAVVEGSIRGETLEIVAKTFENLSLMASTYGGTIRRGSLYPPVVNEAELVELFENFVVDNGYSIIDCGMKYTGEDFGFFSLKYPSLMFWAGTRTGDEIVGLHNPRFLPSDEVIPFLIDFVVKWLLKLWSFAAGREDAE
ncbi:M20 family metallopeptidase [Fervidobacterium thailandense]|uniref:Amidohydrolase n=1 Tax=Fervidobacterium thailandense TaxID=1008305 RepID=A0A1E3G325_9BACT|nr:M20 family metallopeptidase [Fervidobacterium thailandense]ODN30654.1 amidohydrolase [Fervidobacterium thailandense]